MTCIVILMLRLLLLAASCQFNQVSYVKCFHSIIKYSSNFNPPLESMSLTELSRVDIGTPVAAKNRYLLTF